MAADRFYVIDNDLVTNIAVYREEDAIKLNLKRFPIINEHGRVHIGWTYLKNENIFLPPPRDIVAEWEEVEVRRRTLYEELMGYVTPYMWQTYTSEEKDKWREYRDKLANIRNNVIDPRDIVWPEKPIVEQMTYIVPSLPDE